jgi:hypothetical protein
MGLFGGRRLRDPVEGTFRVTGTAVTAGEDGDRHVRLSGVLTGTGVPATGAQVSKTFLITETIPATGDELPAMIDRARPNRFTIAWPARANAATKALQDKAYAERVAAALRLGLDPSLVPAETGPSPTIRELANRAFDQRLARDLLPDGNRPVTVEEANDLYVNGLPGVATITGIDFLAVSHKALPNAAASLANVAVTVTRDDGTSYGTTARFGFRTGARRAQIGFVGARVPVRIDPADPKRVCLDAPALPEVTE